ncbi:MAG: hypothetical protein ACT443_02475 [Gemmatimonadota bacterium]
MGLDIRLPIGLMFTMLGAVLAGFGLVSDPAVYARSLGHNVNLWWGLVLLAFGIAFVYYGLRATRRLRAVAAAAAAAAPAAITAEERPPVLHGH